MSFNIESELNSRTRNVEKNCVSPSIYYSYNQFEINRSNAVHVYYFWIVRNESEQQSEMELKDWN